MDQIIWDQLSIPHKIGRILWIFFFSVSMAMLFIGLPIFVITLFSSSADHFDRLFAGGMAGFGAVVFPLSLLWSKIEFGHWKIRYLIPGKAFQSEFSSLATHFGIDKDELKLLKKNCKNVYHVSGKLFDNEQFTRWQSRERDLSTTCALAVALNECIKDGSGFEGLILRIDREEFHHFDRETGKDNPVSGYEVYSRLTYGAFQGAPAYLLGRVFTLCDFSLYDNGLSPTFTKKNEENREKLKNVYSPILFSYAEEVSAQCARVEALAEKA